MPHIIIEHQNEANAEIDLNNLSKTLHNYLAEHETINKAAIKTRSIAVDNVYVGEDSDANKFIHITLLLLAGRSLELKEQIIENLYTKTKEIINNSDYTVTVETRDLGTYFKG